MPAYKNAIDPRYKNVMHEVPYEDMPVRKGASPRPRLGTEVVVPKGSPRAGTVRRIEAQTIFTQGISRDKLLRQGYAVVERIKQPNDQRQLREHQGVGKPFGKSRKGR